MSKYIQRLADEHKLRKQKDVDEMFKKLVLDIYNYCLTLIQKETPATLDDICILHKKLYPKGLWGHSINKNGQEFLKLYPAGELRKDREFTKKYGQEHWYTNPEDIHDSLKEIDKILLLDDMHDLVKILTYIAYFIEIHPFYNGNGTIVRILLGILLMKYGYNTPFGMYRYFLENEAVKDVNLASSGEDYYNLLYNSIKHLNT